MVVYTMTKKQVLRIVSMVLVGIIALAIAIFAVLNAVTASAEAVKLPIYCVDRGDNKIAITFDCAWGNSNTDELLKILADANAKATFFVTGEFCDNYPEDVKKFYDAGHSVQNHSDAHPHVEGMNINDLIEDTRECSRKIKMITGEEPTLYRAPYGEYDNTVMTTVEGMGLKVIQWSVDSIDWEDPDAYTILNRTTTKTESGSILLFHNDLKNTTEALPSVLTELLQQGFEFVCVEDMIYQEDYYIDNSGKQIYEPVSSTITPVVIYADDPYANVAFEKMRLNLTLEEIYNLSVYGQLKIDVIEKNQTYLSRAEIAALQMMSYEELYAAYIALVYAAETYGTADYNPNAEVTTTTAATTAAEPAPEETTTPVTTIGDKTDVEITMGDKTDVTTTADKTDIEITMGDKTDVTTTADKTDIEITMGDKTDVTTMADKTDTEVSMGTKPDIVTTVTDKTDPVVTTWDKTEIVTGIITSYDKTEPVTTLTYPEKTEPTTTTVANTTTTTAANTTTTRPATSDTYDVQAEEITTAEPK